MGCLNNTKASSAWFDPALLKGVGFFLMALVGGRSAPKLVYPLRRELHKSAHWFWMRSQTKAPDFNHMKPNNSNEENDGSPLAKVVEELAAAVLAIITMALNPEEG